ncbi:MAG: amidase [Thalassovita sp.]
MTELLDNDALSLSGMIARKEISAVEVMQATLAQIDRWNPHVNAIVSPIDPDQALSMAAEADNSTRRGWLHGLPIAIKDLANARGLPSSMGSPVFADQGAAENDDIYVARMRAAGALIIGKTNVPEFGLGSHTFNPVFGATRNPYELSRSAGGSSGGAAAALATRMLPIADGSDMMGSLRNPAAWCNVYGLRPTWGRVPNEPLGDMYLQTLATNGPMGRSPADIAALLQVQAGRDPGQPFGVAHTHVTEGLEGPIQGKRIGWLADWGGAYPMEPGILDLCQSALRVFENLGATVEPITPPFPAAKIWDSWQTLRWFAVASKLAPLYAQESTRALLKPAAQWEIENGLALSAMQVHQASVIRSEWFRAAARMFETYDAVVLPSAQVWPFGVEEIHPTAINETPMDSYHRWMEVVVPASLIGLPALSLPVGFGETGLPMGMQLIGAARADKTVLHLGQAYHQATLWPNKMPPKQP